MPLFKFINFKYTPVYPTMHFDVVYAIRDSLVNNTHHLEQNFSPGIWKHQRLHYFCANSTHPDELIMREPAARLEAVNSCRGKRSYMN